MMRLIFSIALAGIGCVAVLTSAHPQLLPGVSDGARKARIELASEFVRELEVLYSLQETAKKEFVEDSSTQGKLMTGIRVGTRTLFEMNGSINRLTRIAVEG